MRWLDSLPRRLPFGSSTAARLLSNLPGGRRSGVLETVLGPKMRLDLSVGHERQMHYGVYERAEASLLTRATTCGSLFIDAGANIGYFTLLASRLTGPTGRVLAFEADPCNAARLVENVAFNDLGNVHVVAKALGDRIGAAELVTGEHAVGSSLETSDGAVSKLGPDYVGACKRSVTVPVTTMDDECEGILRAWRGRKILKADVEGVEPMVLAGGRECLRLLDIALIEQNPFMLEVHGFAACATTDIMCSAGFRAFVINDVHGRPSLEPADEAFAKGGNLLFVASHVAADAFGLPAGGP